MSDSIPFDNVFNNGGQEPLCVPGFGLPLEYWPHRNTDEADYRRPGLLSLKSKNGQDVYETEVRFRHGTNDFRGERLVAREVAMLGLMNSLTEIKEWHKKVFNDQIVANWKQEAITHELISDKAFEWCITELKDKAVKYEESQYVAVLDTDSLCIKSDVLVDATLHADLKAAVKPLLEQSNPDWHPNSNEQVLNLVHPSLYPLVYGRTRVLTSGTVGVADILDHIGHGEVASADQPIAEEAPYSAYRMDAAPSTMQNRNLWSNRFQWLPSEIKFIGDQGSDVKITSYINNLHPLRHQALYSVIEKLIAKSIRPWNEVLIKGLYGRHPPRISILATDFDISMPEWATWDMGDNEELREKVRQYVALPNNPDQDLYPYEEVPDDWEERLDEWCLYTVVESKYKMMRRVAHPQPGEKLTYENWKNGTVESETASSQTYEPTRFSCSLEHTFRERGLQVIVKLASIELTPENPKYKGGSWHLEGMLNEHIVATSIYYYDVQNTTESKIRFRQEDILHDCTVEYEQNDHGPLYEVFKLGIDDFSEGVSEIGSIATPEGRLLTFPNTLQHAVSEFELADPQKPGHRRFLVLWLVDPHYRVTSTANVPPQRHDWWAPKAVESSGIDKLPPEVTGMIMDNCSDWPMGLEEAKALRLELMAERTAYGEAVQSNLPSYNLCEH